MVVHTFHHKTKGLRVQGQPELYSKTPFQKPVLLLLVLGSGPHFYKPCDQGQDLCLLVSMVVSKGAMKILQSERRRIKEFCALSPTGMVAHLLPLTLTGWIQK